MLGKADGRKARGVRKLLVLAATAAAVCGVSGCGGGGGGSSSGGAVKVTVAPAAAIVSLNGTQLFSALVTGVKTIPIASTNGAVRAGNVVTITTTQAHSLLVAQTVVIAGVADASFNGTFIIASVPSSTTFTYSEIGADATSSGGTVGNISVNWFVNDVAGGNSTVGTITSDGSYTAPNALTSPVTATIASNGAVRASNVVTITTTAAHGFFAGQTVTISGVTDASFNGTFVIASAPSTTTFTYSQTAANATSGGGTVSSFSVKIKAVSVADSTANGTAVAILSSNITVTILPSLATVGTGESFAFTASVVNDSQNLGVTWLVKETNAGTIDATGDYTAPATVPSPATATIQATSKADPSKTSTATVTIVTAVAPTFTAITPTSAPQGGLFQDVYLIAGNLRSTSVINFNGVRVLSPQIKIISSSLARIRLTDAQLAVTNTSPGFPIEVVGVATPQFLKVVPVRPALLESSPDSGRQNSGATDVQMFGGYFGPASSPVVVGAFDGNTRVTCSTSVVTSCNPRSVKVTLNPSDQLVPGLYSVSVHNNGAPQLLAASNFAVQPDPASNGPALVTTIPMGAGAAPSAIAADSVLGVAIVALQGTNSVQRIDLKMPTPALLGSPITVGMAPTGVAVDHIRHIAAVVNSTGKSVSVVHLAAGTVLGTIDLSTVTTATPFSVGIDPYSGLGLIAYRSTDSASIINLDANATPTCLLGTAPYCVVGTATVNTGTAPQVALEPKLRWAFVTPGGAGLLSIVDLGRQTTGAIKAAPDGAKRASNAVTIKTAAQHGIDPANPGSVLITGVADPSFNGTFTVTGVPDATTFTYAQTGPSATSGSGRVNFARPLATFTVGTTVRGISINPETERALLTDPNAPTGQVFILSTLDQTNTTLSLNGSTSELGAAASAFQPFTNVGVVVNPLRNEISLICPVNCNPASPSQPQRLTVISTGGTGSGAVVVDPPTNRALVANNASNDVSVISLGSIKSVHVSEVLIPAARQLIPGATLTSGTDLGVTIFGAGLSGGQVRLDGAVVGGGSVSNGGRQLDITIPASFLSAPRRFALDVVNGGTNSNAVGFTVAQAVDVSGTGCTAPQPGAVAIDSEREIAVVANTGCNNVSLVNLNTGAVTQTVAVGSMPAGVAVDSRLGLAVVANTGNATTPGSTVSIVDVDPASSTFGTVKSTVTVGTEPLGVAIDPDSGKAVVTNLVTNTVSMIDLTASSPTAAVGSVNQRPIAVAIDPDRRIAVVANALSGVIDIVDISGAAPVHKSSIFTSSLPTGVVFDAATDLFFVTSSLTNTIFALNPDTSQTASIRVGVNPTSLAYNSQSGTLVTTNTASNTISIVDSQTFTTRATLGIGASPQFAVAIHPRTNLAVVTDQANNRVLFLPLPR